MCVLECFWTWVAFSGWRHSLASTRLHVLLPWCACALLCACVLSVLVGTRVSDCLSGCRCDLRRKTRLRRRLVGLLEVRRSAVPPLLQLQSRAESAHLEHSRAISVHARFFFVIVIVWSADRSKASSPCCALRVEHAGACRMLTEASRIHVLI